MFITRGEARIFATAFGPKSGRVIVGIGGWIGSWELWIDPFSILSESWRTLAYDHRGAGATVAPIESITFEALVDDLFAVLDAYGVERCIVAAESAGALTALAAALKQPERVTGLVIVDGISFRPAQPGPDRMRSGLLADYAATLDWFAAACTPEPDVAPIRRWGRQILDRASPAAALALYDLSGSVDLRPALARITQKTLIIHGAADAIVPLDAARELAEALPDAQLVVLEGAGHVPTLTRPQEVARVIMGYFTGD
jgi:pimeloyl-ACP methyl ester carboxylesterase